MRVLVLGQGGREHAIVKALTMSPEVTDVHVAPGGPGFQKDAFIHSIDPNHSEQLLRLIEKFEIKLVVIGPEAYLASGVSDILRGHGVLVVGPSREAAQLESSKIYAKEFMAENKIPTAGYTKVSSVDETLKAAESEEAPYVLKADGLAAGKGVFICNTLEELKVSAVSIFEDKVLGDAGRKAILESFSKGWELSYIVLTNGESFQALPLSQDHKRLLENDEGPNTGGMGTVAPVEISSDLNSRIIKNVIEPTLEGLQKKNLLYRGALYFGLMIDKNEPSVLEYNVRFGDPEAQVIFPLFKGDWGKVFKLLGNGELESMQWKNLAVACVVAASPGYPKNAKKGVEITGDVFFETPSSYFIHAGTGKDENRGWVTNGGRVINSIGIGSDLKEAIQKSYLQMEKVNWDGIQVRKDIGDKVVR